MVERKQAMDSSHCHFGLPDLSSREAGSPRLVRPQYSTLRLHWAHTLNIILDATDFPADFALITTPCAQEFLQSVTRQGKLRSALSSIICDSLCQSVVDAFDKCDFLDSKTLLSALDGVSKEEDRGEVRGRR